jgi:hypothetical protein
MADTEYVRICSIPLDTDVILCENLLGNESVRIVGKYKGRGNGSVCVAWKERRKILIPSCAGLCYWMGHDAYTFVLTAEAWGNYSWIDGSALARIVGKESELVIKHPDQKCIGCGLPAPHAEPNTERGFLCIGCKVANEF